MECFCGLRDCTGQCIATHSLHALIPEPGLGTLQGYAAPPVCISQLDAGILYHMSCCMLAHRYFQLVSSHRVVLGMGMPTMPTMPSEDGVSLTPRSRLWLLVRLRLSCYCLLGMASLVLCASLMLHSLMHQGMCLQVVCTSTTAVLAQGAPTVCCGLKLCGAGCCFLLMCCLL